jgi:hypothetical protein
MSDMRSQGIGLLQDATKGSQADASGGVSAWEVLLAGREPDLLPPTPSSILDSLHHENVVQLIDKILDKGQQKLYIVMEVRPVAA